MKFRVGMYGGSFNPLHNGHIKCIKKALSLCDEVHLIIGNLLNRDDFSIETKLSWFMEVFKDCDNLYLHTIIDESKEKVEYSLDKWIADSNVIKGMIGKPIDVVFCGQDYDREDSPYKVCYPESALFFLDRGDDISSSRFKKDVLRYKDDVPQCVLKSYLERQV